jgi:hypothetical protein
MYTIDDLDTITELIDVPRCSTGAPCPAIISAEHFLHLAYYLEEQDEWDGKTVRFENRQRSDERCAVVRFQGVGSYTFGIPDENSLEGHPLYGRGLRHYRFSEVKNSSWVRAIQRIDSFDSQFNPKRFANLRHLIFPFHDSTFECVANSFELYIERGFVSDVLRASCKNSWLSG